MGNGTSMEASKAIYVNVRGNTQKIIFSRHCSSRDIFDLLAQTAGVHKFSEVTLKDDEGGFVTISPTMPTNKPGSAYILNVTEAKKQTDEAEILRSALTEIADNFNKAFQLEELHKNLVSRMEALEKKVELDDLTTIEVEKCKVDIKNIRDQIFSTHKKIAECNTLSPLTDSSEKRQRSKSVAAFEKYTLSQETIDYLKQPTFDIWYWEPNEMLSLLEHMYHELGLVKEFNMNKITLKRWLLCVQENYRNNPFHNFRHCFCVTQMMYGVIHKSGLLDKLTREDVAVLITSCVCHDLDHPGYNNTYQVNAKTELAIRYNDISPLENHHCAVAFQILSNPETNIFSNVDQVTFKRIRSGMITLILATDMARHGEILANFKDKMENFDFAKDEHLTSLKMVLIKCCDISNEVRPFEVSEPWVDCLLEEYFNQSDKEKMQGLPVAPFMDRDKVTKPSAQIGFIKFVLIPMFEALSKLFPQLSDVLVQPLIVARDRYETMKEAEKDKQTNKGN